MKTPETVTILAVRLAAHVLNPAIVSTRLISDVPWDATRVVALAKRYRRLNEAACSRELTKREESAKASAGRRANERLAPYGMEMGNPYGLCMYAMPIGSDGTSSTGMVML